MSWKDLSVITKCLIIGSSYWLLVMIACAIRYATIPAAMVAEGNWFFDELFNFAFFPFGSLLFYGGNKLAPLNALISLALIVGLFLIYGLLLKGWSQKNGYYKLSVALVIPLIPLLVMWVSSVISCHAEGCMLVPLLAVINSILGVSALVTYIIGRVKK